MPYKDLNKRREYHRLYMRRRNAKHKQPERTPKERFEAKFIVTPGCWEWVGAMYSNGYGTFVYEGKQTGAHRVSYMLYMGDIPDGMVVMHRCDNRCCVNPDHLTIGTLSDNMKDMHNKGRNVDYTGEKAPQAKLTWDAVAAIREDTRSSREIAAAHGVSPTSIQKVKRNLTWVVKDDTNGRHRNDNE